MINEVYDIWRYTKDWKVHLYKPYLKDSWIDGMVDMLRTNPISNFGFRTAFEEKLASYCGCRYSIAVNSGTSAILIGMMAIGIKPGDTVLGPGYGNIAWVNCCKFLGVSVVALDVRSDNLCLDETLLDEYLTSNTDKVKAVCYINQAGYTGPQVTDISAVCRRHGVILLEDSCNAIGQRYDGKHAGTTGDIGFISFGSPKLLTCGEGGAILINDTNLYNVCNDMAYQGGWYDYPMHTKLNIGLNFVMPIHNAYFLSKQLDDIDELLLMRKRVCDLYMDRGINIQRFHQPPSIYEYHSSNPIKVMNIAKNLKVQLLHKSYTSIGDIVNNGDIHNTVSKSLERNIITLPASLDMDENSMDMVVASIKMGDRWQSV
jgi:perosamine synthetase